MKGQFDEQKQQSYQPKGQNVNQSPHVTLDEGAQKSFRYHRYKKLIIRHIDSDFQGNQLSSSFQQQTCLSIESQPHFEQSESCQQSSQKSGINQQASDKKEDVLVQQKQHKWKLPQEANLPKQCIQLLKTQKKEAFNQILKFLQISFRGLSKKNVLYLFGNKQTGKKTLVYQAIRTNQLSFKEFYLDFSTLSKSNKQQTLCLYNYLKLKSEKSKNETQQIRFLLVINNVQVFIYFLKKNQIYHQFKYLIKNSRITLILIDMQPLDNKLLSGISQYSEVVHIPNNSKGLFSACLLEYIKHCQRLQDSVIMSKPLANFFSVKLNEQNCLQLGMIEKFAQFLARQLDKMRKKDASQGKEVQPITLKVSPGLIQEFKSLKIATKPLIQLGNLNLHQKTFLVSCFIYLKQNDQLAISLPQLQKSYKWVCDSLSIEAKALKQLERDIVTNLETYRLIKVLKDFGRDKTKHILLIIDLSKIRQVFENQTFFRKFFGEGQQK